MPTTTQPINTKKENIGFDIRGDVKVFDFGLVKSLDDHLKSKTGNGYNLTGFTGSIPYVSNALCHLSRAPGVRHQNLEVFSLTKTNSAAYGSSHMLSHMYPWTDGAGNRIAGTMR